MQSGFAGPRIVKPMIDTCEEPSRLYAKQRTLTNMTRPKADPHPIPPTNRRVIQRHVTSRNPNDHIRTAMAIKLATGTFHTFANMTRRKKVVANHYSESCYTATPDHPCPHDCHGWIEMATNHWHMSPTEPAHLDDLQEDLRKYMAASHNNPETQLAWNHVAMAMVKATNPTYGTLNGTTTSLSSEETTSTDMAPTDHCPTSPDSEMSEDDSSSHQPHPHTHIPTIDLSTPEALSPEEDT